MSQGGVCFSASRVVGLLDIIDIENQISIFNSIQLYVLITIFVLLFQLGYLIKHLAYGLFKFLSKVTFILLPILIAYIFGLTGKYTAVVKDELELTYKPKTIYTFRYLACAWLIFLLFAYAENLNVVGLNDRLARIKLSTEFMGNMALILFIMGQLPANSNAIALACAFIVLTCKFTTKLFALAHAAGVTPKIKKDVTSIIDYANREDLDGVRSGYLVGAKYAKFKSGEIVAGFTMEDLMGSSPEINMELKDTCLSFSLFWLLLGKIRSYPLYDSRSSSKGNAWKLVRQDLLADNGGHERVFRVIEIELAFLRDYFEAKYIFFYFHGFYWKFLNFVTLPIMFWWFSTKAVDQNELNSLTDGGYGRFGFTEIVNKIIISVIVALEVMHMTLFLTSRWLKVTLLCFYLKKMASENTGYLSRVFIEALRYVFLGYTRSSNKAWWRKPWKREVDQFSLVKSYATWLKPIHYIEMHIFSLFQIPKISWDKTVVLSDQVKEAVVLCLQRNKESLELSNGAASLSRNGVMGILPVWACIPKNDIEAILVWHIATSVCELDNTNAAAASITAESTHAKNMKVATELSKYCAFLLFYSPDILPVPSLASRTICGTVVEDAMRLFQKPIFSCGRKEDEVNYQKLKDQIRIFNDEEARGNRSHQSVLRKGAKLGGDLVTLVKNEERRWKILAEFWTEMILYLAPSDDNQYRHAMKLSEGGEFITHIWALLIHAGIYDRDDIVQPSKF